MKVRISLCTMALWAMCAAAQPPQHLQPRILEDGFRLMPSPYSFSVNTMKDATTRDMTSSKKAFEEQLTSQVDFELEFDTNEQSFLRMFLLNLDKNTTTSYYELKQGSNILEIPNGTYDIIVQINVLDLTQPSEWPDHTLTVIREQVTINQDMQLHFAADEAKNHIDIQLLTIDGEPVYTGKWAVDDNWNWTMLEEGNTSDVDIQNHICCKDYGGAVCSDSGNYGYIVEGNVYHTNNGERLADFYVNDVSDRYSFISFCTAMNGYDVFTSSFEVKGASSDTVITNDPSKFSQPFEFVYVNQKHQNEELFRSFEVYQLVEGVTDQITYTVQGLPLTEGVYPKYYLSSDANDNSFGFVHIVQPSLSIKEYGYINRIVMESGQLYKMDDRVIYANSGTNEYDYEYRGEVDDDGIDRKQIPTWPPHPAFSYSAEKAKGMLANNCPVLQCSPYQFHQTYIDWESDETGNTTTTAYYFIPAYRYIGRYGETEDKESPVVSFKLNGEEFIQGVGASFAQLQGLMAGEIDATLVNEGFFVDDIAGSNRAQIHYTAGAEDETSPTTTMLHFIERNGDVTDRFASADDGAIEFSAGDFNIWETPMGYYVYDRYAPETVEVSYSPYGEDNWNELTVEEVPENYWPVMGWFYTGSLAGVTGQGLNGWFDLKIRLEDTVGNWQEQVLSPAFRIDDLAYSSVANVGSDNAREVARYNLAGQRVDGDAKGVVIVKMSDGTARKVLVQ